MPDDGEKIVFTADLTRVRDAIDRFIADARSRAVNLPVAPLPGTSTLSGSGMIGIAPSAAAVFGTPSNAASFGFPNWSVPGGGGGAGGAGGGGGPAFSGTFAGRGFSRLVGAGYLINGGLRVAEAYRDYNIATILAGHDQREQLDATLKLREDVITSFGQIGRHVALFQDPSGNQMAGIRATVGEADVREKLDAAAAANARFFRDQSNRGYVSSDRSGFGRAMRAREVQYRDAVEKIDDRWIDQGKLNATAVDAIEKTKNADFEGDVEKYQAGQWYAGNNVTIEDARDAIRRRNRDDVDVERNRLGRANDANRDRGKRGERDLYERDRNDLIRDEGYRRAGAITAYGWDVRGSLAGLAGDAEGERRAAFAASNAAAYASLARRRDDGDIDAAEFAAGAGTLAMGALRHAAGEFTARVAAAREVNLQRQYDLSDARARGDVSGLLLARNPIAAGLRSLNMEEDEATRGKTDDVADSIRSDFANRRQLLQQRFDDDRDIKLKSLRNTGRQLLIASEPGAYAGAAARAQGVYDDAMLDLDRLQQDNGAGQNDALIRQRLRVGMAQAEQQKKELMDHFRPQEVSVDRSDLSGGGGNGGADKVVAKLDEVGKQLERAIKSLDLLAQ